MNPDRQAGRRSERAPTRYREKKERTVKASSRRARRDTVGDSDASVGAARCRLEDASSTLGPVSSKADKAADVVGAGGELGEGGSRAVARRAKSVGDAAAV